MNRRILAISAAAALAVLLPVGVARLTFPVAAAAPSLTDAQRLDAVWAVCLRHEEPECLASPESTPTPIPTSTPTSTPTGSPTSTPTSTPTPTPTVTTTPTPTGTTPPSNGTIGSIPPSGSGPLVCPAGFVAFESRGWWTPKGESFDQYRGVDSEICWPTNGQLPSGTPHFLLHIQLRRLHAPITSLRIQKAGSYGQDVAFQRSVNLAPDAAGYGEWYIDAPVNTSVNSHPGYNEYRVTANVPDDEDGSRQYQSTGLQGRIDGSTATYRTLPWNEARGWYEGHGYTNVRLRQPLSSAPVSGNWTVNWQAARGSGGDPVTYHVAYVDADTHAIPMVLPRVYSEGSGTFSGTTTIDTTQLPNGRHKLLLRADSTASDGTTSGLLQVLFTVANP